MHAEAVQTESLMWPVTPKPQTKPAEQDDIIDSVPDDNGDSLEMYTWFSYELYF